MKDIEGPDIQHCRNKNEQRNSIILSSDRRSCGSCFSSFCEAVGKSLITGDNAEAQNFEVQNHWAPIEAVNSSSCGECAIPE